MGDNIRLLIVEDDPTTAKAYSEYLSGHGYSIKHFDRVQDAIAELRTCNFDAILLDLNVKDSRGLDTLKSIRPHTQTPVVVLTGSIGADVAQTAVSMGASDYLMKDRVRPDIVARVLQRFITQHQRHRMQAMTEKLLMIGGLGAKSAR